MWRSVPVLAVIGGLVAASAQQAPPRDPASDSRALLRGIVVAAADTQQPLRAARLTIVRDGAPIERTASGADGRFQIEVPASGSFTLAVTKAGFAPAQLPLSGSLLAELLQIRLVPGAVLTGHVVDARGAPVASMGIRARLVEPGSREFLTEADDRGEFRIGSLPAGSYLVSLETMPCQTLVTPAGVTPCLRFSWERTERSVEWDPIALGPGDVRRLQLVDDSIGDAVPPAAAAGRSGTAAIGGRIVATDGTPIAGAQVSVARVGGGSAARRWAVSDAAGRYQVAELDAGRYRVNARRGGFHDGEHGRSRSRDPLGEPVDLRDGQQLAGVDVVLSRGSVIAGTNYWAVATLGLDDRIESGEWQTPEVLGSLVAGARRVRLEEGQRVPIELRVMRMR